MEDPGYLYLCRLGPGSERVAQSYQDAADERHPEHEDSLEENWLFEAITETYVPLLLVLEDLIAVSLRAP
jgi:hypothetical protein